MLVTAQTHANPYAIRCIAQWVSCLKTWKCFQKYCTIFCYANWSVSLQRVTRCAVIQHDLMATGAAEKKSELG